VVDLDYRDYIKINPAFFRPDETVHLAGDSTKAKNNLDWKPIKTLDEIVHEMVQSEIGQIKESK
jgi:GDPmannose 4,6-dehydratase